jgi:hypothetical protein
VIGVGTFAFQSIRHFDSTLAARQVVGVQRSPPIEAPAQAIASFARQHDDPIFVALSLSDRELAAFEVNVLDPQAATLEQAQTRPIHESGHQSVRLSGRQIVDGFEQQFHLAGRKHQRDALGPLGANGIQTT